MALQKFCLALHPPGAEQGNGLLYGALHAVYLLVHVHDLLHALMYGMGILLGKFAANAQFAEVAAAHGCTYYQLSARIEVLHGLCQHQEQGQRVGPHAMRGSHILELHVLGIVETVVHALHLVVHKGTHGAVLHVQAAHSIQFLQTGSKGNTNHLPIVAASYS